MISVVVLLMGNRTDPALAAKATPKSNRFTTVSSKPEAESLHTLYSSVGNVGEGAQKNHPGFLGLVGTMLSRLEPKPSRPKIVYLLKATTH